MTATEVGIQAARIIAATELPVIVDIDTGFGGVNNIWRSVRDLELVGVAAVHIEDQASPKTCPAISTNKKLQPREEAVLRVEAAVDARRSDDFVIIARSDADSSFDELVTRSNLYLQAGADVAMPILMEVDGVPVTALSPDQQMETFQKLAAEIDGPVCWSNRAVPTGYTADDLVSAGFSLVLLPIAGLRVVIAGLRRLYGSYHATGNFASYFSERPDEMMSSLELASGALDLEGFLAREERFTWDADANSLPPAGVPG
jgi:methylisocitrate lyase